VCVGCSAGVYKEAGKGQRRVQEAEGRRQCAMYMEVWWKVEGSVRAGVAVAEVRGGHAVLAVLALWEFPAPCSAAAG